MTREEKHKLAKKIIKITNEEIDSEHFIHRLLEESTLYNIYEDEHITFGQRAADILRLLTQAESRIKKKLDNNF